MQPVHEPAGQTVTSHTLALASALSAVMLLCTVILGWLFNAAYYNDNTLASGLELRLALYQPLSSPSIASVMGAFAWFYVACTGLCFGLVYRRVMSRGAPLVTLLVAPLALPPAFILSAYGSRSLLENGWIDFSKIVQERVKVGESFVIGAFRFTQSSHGLGVVNLGDSGSVIDVLFHRHVPLSSFVAIGVGWVVCLVMLVRAAPVSNRS